MQGPIGRPPQGSNRPFTSFNPRNAGPGPTLQPGANLPNMPMSMSNPGSPYRSPGGDRGYMGPGAPRFPTIPEDTVQGAVSQLFRTNPNCTRQQLADASLAALLEMSSSTGGPQARSPSLRAGHTSPGQAGLSPTGAAPVHDELLDSLLAELLGLPDEELKTCVSTLRSIVSRIAEQPDELKFRRLRKHNPRFLAEVGKHKEALALMLHAGFQEQDESEVVLVLGELTESFKQAIRSAAEVVAPPDSRPQSASALPAPSASCHQAPLMSTASVNQYRLPSWARAEWRIASTKLTSQDFSEARDFIEI
eukprot:s4634_g6.t1